MSEDLTQDPLREIQNGVANDLLNNEVAPGWFANVPVICEQKGDILNQIEISLGKLGICVVIEVLTGKKDSQGIGAYSLDLNVGITVTERVVVNQGPTGTKKRASQVVAMILSLLDDSRAVHAWTTGFTLVNDSGGLLIYSIQGKAAAGFALNKETP